MEAMLAASAALAVAFLVIGLKPGAGDRRTRERVASLRDETRFGLPIETAPEEDDAVAHLADRLGRLAPHAVRDRLADLIARGGLHWHAERVIAAWATVAVVAGCAVAWWYGAGEPSSRRGLAALVVIAIVAVLPWYLLRRRADRRVRQISRGLPQALDLIVTNIEGGLGLQAALLVVAQKVEGPIGEEFARATAEISVGVPRGEALMAMAERTGSDDVQAVARAIAQAERSGISIAQLLRARATEMRERRRLTAREQANKVPVKMTIPVVFFIFPTFFLLLLTPVALNAAEVMAQ